LTGVFCTVGGTLVFLLSWQRKIDLTILTGPGIAFNVKIKVLPQNSMLK
jgi:hypothetical protein